MFFSFNNLALEKVHMGYIVGTEGGNISKLYHSMYTLINKHILTAGKNLRYTYLV